MRLGGMSMCRRIKGRAHWPTEPQPSMRSFPSNRMRWVTSVRPREIHEQTARYFKFAASRLSALSQSRSFSLAESEGCRTQWYRQLREKFRDPCPTEVSALRPPLSPDSRL